MDNIKKININGTDYSIDDRKTISLYPVNSFDDRKKSKDNFIFVSSSEDNTLKIQSALQILSDSVGGLS